MSVFGEALKKAGMATDEDIKRTHQEKVQDLELADRMATATLWLEKLSKEDIRKVAKGDFERLEPRDRHALPWHCQEVAFEIACKLVHEGGRKRRERDAAVVAARKARETVVDYLVPMPGAEMVFPDKRQVEKGAAYVTAVGEESEGDDHDG